MSIIRIQSLLNQVSLLSSESQRSIAAVVGSCVADAAARPTHWCYDQVKLDSYIEGKDPEFWPTSLSPYYCMETGQNSCYYDLGYVMLKSLSPLQQPLSIKTYKKNLVSFFGPGTDYNESYNKRPEVYNPEKRLEERKPVEGPWIQKSVLVALSALSHNEEPSGNPESKETDGTVSTIPYVAQLAREGKDMSTSEVQMSIKQAAALLSVNAIALRHTLSAAAILSSIIQNGESALEYNSLLVAVRSVRSDVVGDTQFEDAEEMMVTELSTVFNASPSVSHTKHVLTWGKPCANPGSFMGAMHSVVFSQSYPEAIRKVIIAGGCNCSRANLAGACLGAAYGFGGDRGIPLTWLEKTSKAVDVLELAILKLS
jgi:hypothetical protein